MMPDFIRELEAAEPKALISVMAFMSYNPSIGRVFEEGGVKKFQKISEGLVERLARIQSIHDFDKVHADVLTTIIDTIKTSKNTTPSYGQAQKPVNVFLKLYVDWACKPDIETRERILPFLHVPLDKILMKSIRLKYRDWYRSEISQLRFSPQQEFSLSKIDHELYYKWQSLFRKLHPKKPLIFDVAWAINR